MSQLVDRTARRELAGRPAEIEESLDADGQRDVERVAAAIVDTSNLPVAPWGPVTPAP
ncbi:hypothetical protein Ahu01nite_015030 [Winogradskya humida]|uniref:Uncharacterized protein n=1 Tax=Winogradskya humida TaxID=113566 RepID=A0ABQ3ZIK0_9ACTN|nr:hypothetical protein Ahu01nite_015030 [Actinoplanes humidus]